MYKISMFSVARTGKNCTTQAATYFRAYSSKFIVTSKHADVDIPNVPYTELVWQHCDKWGDRTALECAITGRSYTYTQAREGSRRFANSLLKMGLRRGEVVGIISPNIPEYAIVVLGTSSMGGIITSVDPTYTAEEMARQLQNAEARYAVTTTALLPVVRFIKYMYAGLEGLIVIGDAGKEYFNFSDMLTEGETTEEAGLREEAYEDIVHDTIFLPYSSGTTGLPKGVMLTHHNIVTMMRIWEDLQLYRQRTDYSRDVFIAMKPLFHIYGLVALVFLPMYYGAKIITTPKFEPGIFLDAMDRYRPTVLHLVAPMFNFLCHHPEVKVEFFERVHAVIYSSAAVDASLITKLKEKMKPHTPHFLVAYGMTEGVSATVAPKGPYPIGSCGQVVPNTKVRVLDTTTGEPLGPNQEGEICIQGPQVMKGYFKNPDATDAVVRYQWLHTGDVGYYDENNHFFIVDRVKELIKVKGEQVAPYELEDLLRKHPGVRDVGVIGIPDKKAGELPRAYIVREDLTLSEEAVIQYLHDRVAPHKRLKGGVVFVNNIPKSPTTGKILRKELKEAAMNPALYQSAICSPIRPREEKWNTPDKS